MKVLGAAGFGIGAAIDRFAEALHDDDIVWRVFVASDDGTVFAFAEASEGLLDAARAAGGAVEEGVLNSRGVILATAFGRGLLDVGVRGWQDLLSR